MSTHHNPARTRPASSATSQRGSAVAEFVMVATLLIVVGLSIVQLALALHVRNTLIDAATNGARYGALANRSVEDGRQRTAMLISQSLNPVSPRTSAPPPAWSGTRAGGDHGAHRVPL
ncbi:pilus assembly protein, partial [Arthrobacter sp. JCM 19049]|uniref:TadE family protein n=1 Tax=Arthrobacter sp. JCM 19049 TaxID=1460643 RepID=UPI002436E13B